MNISVDLSDLNGLGKINNKQVHAIGQRVIETITNELYAEISRTAGQGLHQTRNMYLAGLQKPVFGALSGSITLIGDMPNMIEQGASAFDMKAGFKKSAKAKRTKNGGWYLTIPFRMGTPSALAENEAFAGKMSKEAYADIKDQQAQITAPIFGVIRKGVSSKSYGVMVTREGVTGLSKAKNKAYTPKSGKFEGIIKTKKFYEKSSQSSYVMFRRVGSGSAANSWIHKGFQKRDFMFKSVEKMANGGTFDLIKNSVIKTELNGLGLF